MSFLNDSINQLVLDYWSALYNPVQTQQANVGQQLAAGPTAQQPQQQQQATQMPQVQQQQASQQQAPASVPQSQTIGQPQSNVGMVQKVDTAPASINTDPFAINADEINPGGAIGQGSPSGISYQGELKPVYDEAGAIVQWVLAESPARKSAANDRLMWDSSQEYDIWGGKRPGNWNLILPDIQQGGLDQQTIDALGKFQNNPNFYGGTFNRADWEEGPAWIPENFREAFEEMDVLQARGGDPTNYAGLAEWLRNFEQRAFRNKVTGELVPLSQLFRELPQNAADINSMVAEYARSKPWWKEDLVPDIIKGVSAAIAAAAGGAGGAALAGAGGAAAGGTAAGLATSAGAGTGAALAQNAMMEGDIGDRLLPTALAFGGAATMPYVSDYVSSFIPQSWKDAVSGWLPSTGGGEQVAQTGVEELASGLPETGGMMSEEGTVWGSPEELSAEYTRPDWIARIEQLNNPDYLFDKTTQDAINRSFARDLTYSVGDDGSLIFNDPTIPREIPTIDNTWGDPTAYHNLTREGLYNTFEPDRSLIDYGKELRGEDYLTPEELADLRGEFDKPFDPIESFSGTYDSPNLWSRIPEWYADVIESGYPYPYGDYNSPGLWAIISRYLPSASTIAAISSVYRTLFPTTPEVSGTGEGPTVHAGGGAEAAPDFSELAGLLASGRGSAGSGGGGQTGPQAGTGKGGGFGEGGMLALMNLILNEMQKGGKYYFQT